MENNQISRNAISHKELNAFLIKAKQDITSNDSLEQKKVKEEQNFNELIKNWAETSQKILLMMNDDEKNFTHNKSPKSLMAFGAMGAHISMALQALKSTGSDQWY